MAQHQGGRPIKKVPKGERTQIGVIIGGNTKERLLAAMKESGRTISREVEHLIEKALAYDDLLTVLKNIADRLAKERRKAPKAKLKDVL
jgi:dissimilatory sulfite reductase (desulfoviridin) alpha/beta subunit